MQRHRHVEFLAHIPQRIEVRITIRATVRRPTVDHQSLRPLPLHPPHLLDSPRHVPQWNVGHVRQPRGARAAELGYPVVVDPGVSQSEARIRTHRLPRQSQRRVQDHRVYPPLVQHLHVFCRIVCRRRPSLRIPDLPRCQIVLYRVRTVGLARARPPRKSPHPGNTRGGAHCPRTCTPSHSHAFSKRSARSLYFASIFSTQRSGGSSTWLSMSISLTSPIFRSPPTIFRHSCAGSLKVLKAHLWRAPRHESIPSYNLLPRSS